MYENKKAVDYYVHFAENGLLGYEKKIIENFFAPNTKILDIGCGAGRTTKAMSDIGLKNIVGIDISQGMIEKAKKIDNKIDFRTCDVRHLDEFADNMFSGAFFSYNGISLLSFGDKEVAIHEINRILALYGIFIFTCPKLSEKYINGIITEKNIDLSNYYNRIKVGVFDFCDNGEKLNIFIPFENDLVNMLEESGFQILLKESSWEICEDKNGQNETIVWVCKKISNVGLG